METFDRLIHEISSRYHLGPKGRALVENALDMISEDPGGINGFLQKFRRAGLAEHVASWQSGSDPIPLSGQRVEETLGSDVIKDIAVRAAVSQRFARTILGYAIPKIVHTMTRKGFVEIAEASAPGGEAVPLESGGELRTSRELEETVKPWFHTPAGQAVTGFSRQLIIPGIASVATVGLFGYLLLTSAGYDLRPSKTVTASHAATQAMPSRSDQPATTQFSADAARPVGVEQKPLRPPHMMISNQNGLITYSGIVGDAATRATIISSLKAAFGADKIKGNLAVDDHFGPADWTKDLTATLEDLKTAGSQVRFEGDKVSVGGTIPDVERGRIIASLKSTLGPNFAVAEMSSTAPTEMAAASQASKSSAGEGTASVPEPPTLHLPVIYFATNSAVVPPDSKAILEQEAALMKSLPVGTVVRIDGFTDDKGNSAFNMKLSQRRANAVRQILIDAGVNPSLLNAKGNGVYHSAGRENSTGEEGRSLAMSSGNQAADRRVEFHISQS